MSRNAESPKKPKERTPNDARDWTAWPISRGQ